MPVCIVSGCGNRHTKASKIYLASFPSEKDTERRKLWIKNVFKDQPYRQPSIYYYVCEDHFEDNMWEKVRVDGKRKLKKNAVPTIFHRRKCNDSSNECVSQMSEDVRASELDEPKIIHTAPVHSSAISHLAEASDSVFSNEEANGPSDVENDTEALKKRLKQTEQMLEEARNQLTELKKKFEQEPHETNKIVRRLEQSNIQLRKCKKKLWKKNKLMMEKLNRQNGLKRAVRKMLTEDQLEVLTRKASRGIKWSIETMTKALQLKFLCGSIGYEELRASNMPLPSQRTLRRFCLQLMSKRAASAKKV
ncbi:hypothetical protein PV328_004225 [Microctonus aethiopoides]|uniref:THAP-type domain-containing protein n=1 Tax=Microctonus aethiopoides TaxID=144406 RepID=A0AA39FA49_9HYME|nr:hypothetical protein PV328_004225 [Microctonus aethiopoides]